MSKRYVQPVGKYELMNSTPRQYSGYPKNLGPEIKENESIARNAWQSAMVQLNENEEKLLEAESSKKIIIQLQSELQNAKLSVSQHQEARRIAEL